MLATLEQAGIVREITAAPGAKTCLAHGVLKAIEQPKDDVPETGTGNSEIS